MFTLVDWLNLVKVVGVVSEWVSILFGNILYACSYSCIVMAIVAIIVDMISMYLVRVEFCDIMHGN